MTKSEIIPATLCEPLLFVLRHSCFGIYQKHDCGPTVVLRTRPRAWADRRDHDCHRLNDRVWHLYRVSGVIAIEWRAWLAIARVGVRRVVNNHRRAVLLGAGDDDAACGRCLCFSARSLRFIDWFLVWMDVVSRGPNGDDRDRKSTRLNSSHER